MSKGRFFRSAVAWVAILGLVAASGCRSRAALTDLAEARQLASALRVHFAKTVEASNRAVMADTDKASVDAAKEAREATAAVGRTASTLQARLGALGYTDDQARLEEFRKRFVDYTRLDEEILPLAVENTNLKAQRLLFEDARQASDEFRRAIGGASERSTGHSTDGARAVIAVLDIQVILARHIAENQDAVMAAMEKEIEADGRTAHAAVTALGQPGGPAGPALERFDAAVHEILSLSRRNSNVRSLALSLGRKRVVTTECDEALEGLERAVLAHGFNATR